MDAAGAIMKDHLDGSELVIRQSIQQMHKQFEAAQVRQAVAAAAGALGRVLGGPGIFPDTRAYTWPERSYHSRMNAQSMY